MSVRTRAPVPNVNVAASPMRQHLGVILLQFAPQFSSNRSGIYSVAAAGNDRENVTIVTRLAL